MKTILITGGAGFMGSNFVRYLYNQYPDYRLIVLDALTYAGSIDNLPIDINMNSSSRLSFWYGDVRNGELVDTLISQSDVVIHFAAETHVTRSIFDNLHFYETDVLGTQVIVNSVLKYMDKIERFIHISSSEVYGTARTDLMAEDHPLMPMSPYASAKAGADRLVYSYWATYNIPAIILRPFNNYGPNQHLEKAIPRFITSCILDENLSVHGDGNSARDWVYVGDLCRAVDKALHVDIERVKGEAINIGTGKSTSISTIAEMIIKIMGKSSSFIQYVGDRLGQVKLHISSVKKAEELLEWRANVSLEEGLNKTIDWYKKNRRLWEKQMWMRSIPVRTRSGKVEYH